MRILLGDQPGSRADLAQPEVPQGAGDTAGGHQWAGGQGQIGFAGVLEH